MTLVGLDLDATRARAVSGPVGPPPAPLRLGGACGDLPVAVCLEGRHPQVGAAATGLCRRLPDFACLDFLPHLGGPRVWSGGRHCLDADRAAGLVLDHLGRGFGRAEGVAAALPAYLSQQQCELLAHLAEMARWRLLGWLPRPLAAAWAAHDRLPWLGRAIIVDVDGHALTLSAVAVECDRACLVASQSVPALGRNAWLSRLLDGVARRCVRQSRRDPRESAEAEQYLYDQLLSLIVSGPAVNRPAEFVLQTARWYQRLCLPAGEVAGLCAPLAAKSAEMMMTLASASAAHGPVGAVLVTSPAGRLPGLVSAFNGVLQPMAAEPATGEEDFGEGLLQDEDVAAGAVHLLDADAVPRAAHQLAVRIQSGEVQRGPAGVVRLPPRGAGPRLHSGEPDSAPPGYRIPFPGADPGVPHAAPPPARRRSPKDTD
jgi:hypothetical protein